MINPRQSYGKTSSPPTTPTKTFPSVADLEAAPALLLQEPFRPAWCHAARLITKGSEERSTLQSSDLPLAVSLTLRCGNTLPVKMDYWDFAYLAALSQHEGHVRPNSAKKGGKPYIRFKASGPQKLSMMFPVGRILLSLAKYQNVKHRDGNRRNLLRSNLETIGGFAQRDARRDLDLYQIGRAGSDGEALALSLIAITEHHEKLLASLPQSSST
jgi:hypothetical protein